MCGEAEGVTYAVSRVLVTSRCSLAVIKLSDALSTHAEFSKPPTPSRQLTGIRSFLTSPLFQQRNMLQKYMLIMLGLLALAQAYTYTVRLLP